MKKKLKLHKNKENISVFLSIVSILFVNFSVNSWISLKAQCLDDITYWTIYNTTTAGKFIMNNFTNKCRPVYNVVIWCLYKIFGENIGYFQVANLLISFLIACVIFFMAKNLSKDTLIGFFISIAYIVSRFAYYQISQVFGIMEAMALLFAILVLYNLQKFLDFENGGDRSYYIASLFYGLICFTHERYMTLVFIFIIVYLLKEKFNKLDKRRLRLILIPVGIFIFSLSVRKYFIGSFGFEGTSGTSLTDTVNIMQIFTFIGSQIGYIFGVNLGEIYLNGIRFENVSPGIYTLIIVSLLAIIMTLSLFIKIIMKNSLEKRKYVNKFSVFICFIGICIVSSSITIRVEMRWIYVSFTAMLLLFAYMLGVIKNNLGLLNFKYSPNITIILAVVYIITLFPTELYYRSYYPNLYYWQTQKSYNSLYDLSVKKYEKSFWTSNIVIINDKYENVNEESLKNFYNQFKSDKSVPDPKITIVSKISEISEENLENGSIILGEDAERGTYIDLTQVLSSNYIKSNIKSSLKETKIDSKIGVWEGNKSFLWTKDKLEVTLKSKENGKMRVIGSILKFNLPNTVTLYVNSEKISTIELNDENIDLIFDVPKNQVLNINLVLDNTKSPYEAGEGEDRRSLGICFSNIIME